MNRRTIAGLAAAASITITLSPLSAMSADKSLKQQLIGTWSLTSWEQTRPDGTKVARFGDHPKGVTSFLPNGRFFIMIHRSDLPKIASNDAMNPTPDEAKALTVGAIAYYGTYTVSEKDKTVTEKLEGTTFPNQMDIPQKRIITAISATEMRFSNPGAVGGGHVELAWKRVK
jgi:hypothetical protein